MASHTNALTMVPSNQGDPEINVDLSFFDLWTSRSTYVVLVTKLFSNRGVSAGAINPYWKAIRVGINRIPPEGYVSDARVPPVSPKPSSADRHRRLISFHEVDYCSTECFHASDISDMRVLTATDLAYKRTIHEKKIKNIRQSPARPPSRANQRDKEATEEDSRAAGVLDDTPKSPSLFGGELFVRGRPSKPELLDRRTGK